MSSGDGPKSPRENNLCTAGQRGEVRQVQAIGIALARKRGRTWSILPSRSWLPVKNRAFLFKVRCRGIERRALNGRRAHNLHEPRDGIHFNSLAAEALKGSAFVVVSETKTSPRSDVQPAKKLRRVGKLVNVRSEKTGNQGNRTGRIPVQLRRPVGIHRHSSRHYSTRASQKNGVA